MERLPGFAAKNIAKIILENESLKEKGKIAYFFGRKFVVVQGDTFTSYLPTNLQRIRWALLCYKPEKYRRATIEGKLQARIDEKPDDNLLQVVKKYFNPEDKNRKNMLEEISSVAAEKIMFLSENDVKNELQALSKASDDVFKERVQQLAVPALRQLMEGAVDGEAVIKKLESSLVEAIEASEVTPSKDVLSKYLDLPSKLVQSAAAKKMLPLIGMDAELAQNLKDRVEDPYIRHWCDRILTIQGVNTLAPQANTYTVSVKTLTGGFINVNFKKNMTGAQAKSLIMREMRNKKPPMVEAQSKWNEMRLIVAGKKIDDDKMVEDDRLKELREVHIVGIPKSVGNVFDEIQDEKKKGDIISAATQLQNLTNQFREHRYPLDMDIESIQGHIRIMEENKGHYGKDVDSRLDTYIAQGKKILEMAPMVRREIA